MNKETEVYWIHCQGTHYCPAQPVSQKPRQVECFQGDWFRPGFHEEENINGDWGLSGDAYFAISETLPYKLHWDALTKLQSKMSKEVKNYDCIDLVVGDGDDDLTAPLLAFATAHHDCERWDSLAALSPTIPSTQGQPDKPFCNRNQS